MTKNIIKDLISWYKSECDGDWEHGEGITIKTLDNPGWSLTVEIPFEEEDRELFSIDRSPGDWLFCCIRAGQFKGAGGPDLSLRSPDICELE